MIVTTVIIDYATGLLANGQFLVDAQINDSKLTTVITDYAIGLLANGQFLVDAQINDSNHCHY